MGVSRWKKKMRMRAGDCTREGYETLSMKLGPNDLYNLHIVTSH